MGLKFENIGDVDLLDCLHFDTFLSVKMDKKEGGGTVFVSYIIPRLRRNESERSYTDVISYFRNQSRFRFGRGFLLEETTCKTMWVAKRQYLYFDNRKATFEDKSLEIYLYHNKKKPTRL